MSLTSGQKRAVAHQGTHALVLSGPGTGKTTTLVERCRFLLQRGTPLESLFVCTFTQKAAAEIRERLAARVSTDRNVAKTLKGAYIGTFHSLAARMIKLFPAEAGLPRDFKIFGEDDQRRVLFQIAPAWDDDDGNLVEIIAGWKDGGVDPETARATAKEMSSRSLMKAAEAYAGYQKHMTDTGCVDFADIISIATGLLAKNRTATSWFAEKFTHVIVDEFQDSNISQIKFLREAVRCGANLWAVADEDQTLYEWRGSKPQYCLQFPKLFPGAIAYKLEENFRSPPIVIETANNLISRNQKRYKKTLVAAKSPRNDDSIMVREFRTNQDEARWVAEMMQHYRNKKYDLKNCAILVRTGSTIPAIQSELERLNIPFNIVGAPSFWEMPEVAMFINTIRAIALPDPETHLRKLGRTRSGRALVTLATEMRGEPLRATANAIANALRDNIPSALDAERRTDWLANTEAMLNICLDAENNGKLLEYAKAGLDRSKARQDNSVTISTLHSAKGLEWPVTVIIGAEEDNMPHFKSQNIEEERRLFYVAITRAKVKLTITYCASRNEKKRAPSRFLKEAFDDGLKSHPQVSWFTVTETESKDPATAAPEPTSQTGQGSAPAFIKKGRGVFKHRSGKSLIPPEERGK